MSAAQIALTHGVTLPRPDDLTKLVSGLGETDLPEDQREACIAQAVSDVVNRQVEVGIEVSSDGVMSKPDVRITSCPSGGAVVWAKLRSLAEVASRRVSNGVGA